MINKKLFSNLYRYTVRIEFDCQLLNVIYSDHFKVDSGFVEFQ